MFCSSTVQRRLLTRLISGKPVAFSSAGCASVRGIPEDDAVTQIVGYFNYSPPCHNTKFLINSIRTDVWFRNEVARSGPSEIDAVLEKLSPDYAIDFFSLLQKEFGFKHSRNSWFIIAHILVEKKQSRALKCHLQNMLQEEGSGSAPLLCDLLLKCFSGWNSTHLVWDMLAFVYSRAGMVHDALVVLSKMKDFDIPPSVETYNSLMHNLRHSYIMQDVYRDLEDNGIHPTDYTNSIFLDGLCKQSLIHEAIPFLQKIKEKETEPCVVWFNTLMSSFCRMGYVDIAKSFFCVMVKSGISADAYSYNILIHGLCVTGFLEEAIDFAIDMEKHGLEPDEVTYTILAKGFRLLYLKGGAGKVSEKVLNRNSNSDLTYTIQIYWHCQFGNVEEGFRLREEMLSKGHKLNGILYRVLFSTLCKSRMVKEALLLLSEIENTGFKPDAFMGSMIVHGLCKLGKVEKAIQLYKEICVEEFASNPQGSISLKKYDILTNSDMILDVASYNTMIDRYMKLGDMGEAIKLYGKMLEKGVSPTIVTLNSLITGSCKTGKHADVKKWLADIKMYNLVPTVATYTTLLNAFFEVGDTKNAFGLLKDMKANGVEPNKVTYSVIMKCFCKQGKLEKSVEVLRDMIARNLSPDQGCYNILIKYFCKAKNFKRAFELHDEMVRFRIKPNQVTYDTLINGFCVYGDLGDAEKLFSFLKGQKFRLSKVAYTTLIKAHCAKGDAWKALALFHQMSEAGFEISVKDYSAAINRLCKRSLLSDVMEFLRMMLVDGFSPDEQMSSDILRFLDEVEDCFSKFQIYALIIKCG
ncbi:putative pentatricopeptide repeat-containing protein At1g13630 isoform X2 [Andrographis paniculata]|uniref:putative pentatricopeptide repeat-containing protein At1g13630 isoform X2 n=1 Tax=Andrographis paniculata TaxID=175694 RepID=UPI0021E87715|nr:putative pentatricopeptide repeat-containing protein At1g13630 isoform X2 [Andrographis paniculata]